MEFYQIIKAISKREHLPMRAINRKMGMSDRYLSVNIARGSLPKVDNAARILEACGYSLCAIPGDKVPDEAYVISYNHDELIGKMLFLKREYRFIENYA